MFSICFNSSYCKSFTDSKCSNQVCVGSTITLSPTTGGTWTSSNTSFATVTNAGVVTGIASGSPTFTFTNTSTGCTANTSAVTVNALPTVAALTGTNTVCVGNTTTFASTTTGGTYSSSNTSIATINSSNGIITGVAAGTSTISYVVTNANGCSTTVTRVVTVNALPTVAALTGTNTVCVGITTTFASTTTGGTFSSGSPSVATINSSTGIITGVAAGTSTISYVVTNANGCSTTVTRVVTVNALPTVAALTGTNSICIGNTTTFSSTTTGGTFSSSNILVATVNSSTGEITGISSGTSTISFIVTNGNGCSTTVTRLLTVNALPTVPTLTGTNTVCVGSTTTFSSTTTGGTFSSSNTFVATVHPSSGVITGIASGSATISYLVTNVSGCSETATRVVTVNALPTVAALTGTNTVCVGNTTTFASTTTGGTFSSGSPSIATINSSTGIITGVAAGTSTISYVVTDANGCSTTVTRVVTVNALPTVAALTGTNTVCVGNTTTFASTTTGGTYSSSNTSVATINSSTGIITGIAAGTSTISYIVTDANGCSTTVTRVVTVNALPTSTFSQTNVLCFGNSTGSVTVAGAGGTSPYTYQLGTGTFQSSGTFGTLAAGSYTITVKDANNCTTTQAVTITQPAAAVSSSITSQTNVLCFGNSNGSVTVAGAGGTSPLTYQLGTGTFQSSGTFGTLAAGSYTITVKDANNCTTTQAVTITEPSTVLSISTTNYTLDCNEMVGNVSVSPSGGSSGYTYDWDNDGTGDFDDNLTLTGVVAGLYKVVVKDANGCEVLDSAEVVFTPCPKLSITKVVDLSTVSTPGPLSYTITVRNEGNTDLHNVVLTDNIATATYSSGDNAATDTLNVGETWTYTATYNVTQEDINDGSSIVNIAGVTTTELPTASADSATTTINATDSLSITKVVDLSTVSTPGPLSYTITVKNEGNTDLHNVVVTDNIATATYSSGDVTATDTLNVGETWTYTATYNVSQEDINDGSSIVNIAGVTTTELPTASADSATTTIIQPPVAVNDSSNNNPFGSTVSLNIIANDTLSTGNNPLVSEIQIDLDTITAGIQDSLVVAGEGVYRYASLTGELTFSPEVGFVGNPTPVVYNLIENATGLDSTATIVINYNPEILPPVAVNDSSSNNPFGSTVSLNIIANDTLSTGNNPLVSEIQIDLDTMTAGIQDSLVVAGEGVYRYASLTGELTFSPEVGFVGNPTPVVYNLIENATGLDSTATIVINYNPQILPPVAVNDSSNNNPFGSTVSLNIIANDTLSTGNNPLVSEIMIDLDTMIAGIQDSLIIVGEGRYDYNSSTGEVTFTPEVNFLGNPSPRIYNLIENLTGKDSTASIVVTYYPVHIAILDPCNCADSLNFVLGMDQYFHDIATVFGPAGLTVTLDETESSNLTDNSGNPINTPLQFAEVSPGKYELDIWYKKSTPYVIKAVTNNGLEDTFNGICTLNCAVYADIEITKLVNTNTPSLNDTIQFSILVKNNGGTTATNILVMDSLTSGFIYVSGSATNGVWNYPNLTIASLDSGEIDTLTIFAKVDNSGLLFNTATFISSDQIDTVTTNNEDKVCVTVPMVTCEGTAINISAPSGATNVVWYKNNEVSPIGSGTSLSVTESGNYSFTSDTDVCGSNGCCPIIVFTEVCCTQELFVPVRAKKIKN